jgi:hypothetical protein
MRVESRFLITELGMNSVCRFFYKSQNYKAIFYTIIYKVINYRKLNAWDPSAVRILPRVRLLNLEITPYRLPVNPQNTTPSSGDAVCAQ